MIVKSSFCPIELTVEICFAEEIQTQPIHNYYQMFNTGFKKGMEIACNTNADRENGEKTVETGFC